MGTLTVWARAILVGDIVFVGGQAYRVIKIHEHINDVWQFDANLLGNDDFWVVFSMRGTNKCRIIRGIPL